MCCRARVGHAARLCRFACVYLAWVKVKMRAVRYVCSHLPWGGLISGSLRARWVARARAGRAADRAAGLYSSSRVWKRSRVRLPSGNPYAAYTPASKYVCLQTLTNTPPATYLSVLLHAAQRPPRTCTPRSVGHTRQQTPHTHDASVIVYAMPSTVFSRRAIGLRATTMPIIASKP